MVGTNGCNYQYHQRCQKFFYKKNGQLLSVSKPLYIYYWDDFGRIDEAGSHGQCQTVPAVNSVMLAFHPQMRKIISLLCPLLFALIFHLWNFNVHIFRALVLLFPNTATPLVYFHRMAFPFCVPALCSFPLIVG